MTNIICSAVAPALQTIDKIIRRTMLHFWVSTLQEQLRVEGERCR
jgi:hypothetical protein